MEILFRFPASMFDLFAIGDVKLDTFVLLNQASVQCQLKMPACLLCLEYGAKVDVEVVDAQIAGSAPNVATGLARAGYKTGVVSNMGVDSIREMALKHLAAEGVSAKFIHVVPGEASSSSVVLNYKGDRTILTSHIRKAYRFPKSLPKSKWLYVGEVGEGYEMLYRSVESHARKHEIRLALNPGSIQIKERRPVLMNLIAQTELLFVNKEEAQTLSGVKSIEAHHLAPALFKLGCKHVIITDGKNGSYHFDGNTIRFCPIYPGKLVETTGAGDAYASGFLAAFLAKKDAETAMKWGSINAASVVGKVGPSAGLLSSPQIHIHLRRTPHFHTEHL